MTRQPEKHSVGKTSAAQQRINRAMSVASLSRLLLLNFSDEAYQIVLAYEASGYVPVGVYAMQDAQDWIRGARRQLCAPLRYVRTMEQRQGDDKPLTVHRVVVLCQRADAERIAAKWTHGPAWVKYIEPGQLPALAEQFSSDVTAGSGRHSWASSRNLMRS